MMSALRSVVIGVTRMPGWVPSVAMCVLGLNVSGCGGSSSGMSSGGPAEPPVGTETRLAQLIGQPAETGILEPDVPLTWKPSDRATKYYVYVGTAPGLQDISSSGETTASAYRIPPSDAARVPDDRTVHIRLHSYVDGHWEYVDYPVEWHAKAQLLQPLDEDDNVDVGLTRFTWSAMARSQAYYLYVGSASGAKDVVDTGETDALDYRATALPGGRTLYARIQTKIDGHWRYSDTTFVTRPAAALVYPHHGQTGVRTDRAFEWRAVPGADGYRIEIGSAPGASDLLDSAETTDTSITAPNLPSVGAVYARVWTRRGEAWLYSDAIFSLAPGPVHTEMSWLNGSDNFAARDAFRWSASPLAESFRLSIGYAPDGSELHDSGPIRTVRRLVGELPTGVDLFGTLKITFLDGSTEFQHFEFRVQDSTLNFEDRWQHALWATGEVRLMATSMNIADPNTDLIDDVRKRKHEKALCTDYATALLSMLSDANIGVQAHQFNICLNPNGFECHTLIEVLDPGDSRWLILDPTFGLTARRRVDGDVADALDIHASLRDRAFDDVEYVFLTGAGAQYAMDYYLDYPLLYALVYQPGSSEYRARLATIREYFESVGSTTISGYGLYAVRCFDGTQTASLIVDGRLSVVSCTPGIDNISSVMWASSISPADEQVTYELLRPRRFVFD